MKPFLCTLQMIFFLFEANNHGICVVKYGIELFSIVLRVFFTEILFFE